jgi:hypothetical protein
MAKEERKILSDLRFDVEASAFVGTPARPHRPPLQSFGESRRSRWLLADAGQRQRRKHGRAQVGVTTRVDAEWKSVPEI